MEKLYVTRFHRASQQLCRQHPSSRRPSTLGHPSRCIVSTGIRFRAWAPGYRPDRTDRNGKLAVHKAHEQRLATLQQDLDQALRDQAGSLSGLGEIQATERTIAAINELQALFATRLQATRDQAYSFFGGDPVNRNLHEFLAVARKPNAPADPQQAWLDSYRAAFDVKYLE